MIKEGPGPQVRWIHEVKVEGAVAFRAGKQGAEMIAHWPGLGKLTCARDGSRATFEPVVRASPRLIGKLERAQVRGLLRDLAGRMTVHASAVAVEGRAVLFLGSDGAGKSTAAAEMCLRHGSVLLADDAASIDVSSDHVWVAPSEADHWLTRRSRQVLGIEHPRGAASRRKHAVQALSVGSGPCPLGLVIALRFDPSVTAPVLRPLPGGEAARLLLEAAIRFDVEDGEARRRELGQIAAVYGCAPFLELVRPLKSPGNAATFVIEGLGHKGP